MWAGTLQNTLDLGGLPPIRATGCLDLAREHVGEVLVGGDAPRLPLADLADHRLGIGVRLPLRACVRPRGLLLSAVLRHVGAHERHPRLLQARDEVNIAAQAIQLRDQQPSATAAALIDGSGKRRAGIVLAALVLLELPNERPVAPVEEPRHGLALRLDPE